MATKTQIKGFLKSKLASDKKWANTALIKIFEFQTNDEQQTEYTKYVNSVGFSGVDAKILSSLTKFYAKNGFLTPKQQIIVFKKMPKYWKQILEISDTNKLETLIK
jgi:hypothetical protein